MRPVAAGRFLGRYLPFLGAAFLLLPGVNGAAAMPALAAGPTFSFNWNTDPTGPKPWVPAAANDWDLVSMNSGTPSDQIQGGPFAAAHGPDCAAPPAVHLVSNLADTVYLCKDHMMTAANDSNVFFTPNQIADFSQGTASITFQVSTFRNSQRDWWEVWLMPFGEDYALPTDDAPAFNGNPNDALHIVMNQRIGCSIGQPTWPLDANSGTHEGTMFQYTLYRGGNAVQKGGGDGACMEDAAGGPSAKTRSTFELDVSQHHVKFLMHGAAATTAWIDDDMTLPFSQAVVTWGHRSYNPSKACGFDGTCGPNTFHWSNVTITPSLPFTMLRAAGGTSVHDGAPTTVTLPEPAPASGFLRFAAFGTIQVSYDGRPFVAPHMQDSADRVEGASNYFSPIPAGTRSIAFRGSTRAGSQPWWVQDVAVWATTTPLDLPAIGTPPSPQAAPAPSAAAIPAPTARAVAKARRAPKRHGNGTPWGWLSDRFWDVIHGVGGLSSGAGRSVHHLVSML